MTQRTILTDDQLDALYKTLYAEPSNFGTIEIGIAVDALFTSMSADQIKQLAEANDMHCVDMKAMGFDMGGNWIKGPPTGNDRPLRNLWKEVY